MKFFKLKKIADEWQEIEMLRITSIGFWILLLGLVVHMFVQVFIGNLNIGYFVGELFLIFIVVGYVEVGYAREGLWSCYFKPNAKTNFLLSMGAAAFVGIMQIISRALNGLALNSGFLFLAIII